MCNQTLLDYSEINTKIISYLVTLKRNSIQQRKIHFYKFSENTLSYTHYTLHIINALYQKIVRP